MYIPTNILLLKAKFRFCFTSLCFRGLSNFSQTVQTKHSKDDACPIPQFISISTRPQRTPLKLVLSMTRFTSYSQLTKRPVATKPTRQEGLVPSCRHTGPSIRAKLNSFFNLSRLLSCPSHHLLIQVWCP